MLSIYECISLLFSLSLPGWSLWLQLTLFDILLCSTLTKKPPASSQSEQAPSTWIPRNSWERWPSSLMGSRVIMCTDTMMQLAEFLRDQQACMDSPSFTHVNVFSAPFACIYLIGLIWLCLQLCFTMLKSIPQNFPLKKQKRKRSQQIPFGVREISLALLFKVWLNLLEEQIRLVQN